MFGRDEGGKRSDTQYKRFGIISTILLDSSISILKKRFIGLVVQRI